MWLRMGAMHGMTCVTGAIGICGCVDLQASRPQLLNVLHPNFHHIVLFFPFLTLNSPTLLPTAKHNTFRSRYTDAQT